MSIDSTWRIKGSTVTFLGNLPFVFSSDQLQSPKRQWTSLICVRERIMIPSLASSLLRTGPAIVCLLLGSPDPWAGGHFCEFELFRVASRPRIKPFSSTVLSFWRTIRAPGGGLRAGEVVNRYGTGGRLRFHVCLCRLFPLGIVDVRKQNVCGGEKKDHRTHVGELQHCRGRF